MDKNNIVFFFDIDDTFLFSKRKVDFSRNIEIGAYDKYNQPFSFIYKELKIILDLFKENKIILVPNSARNLESYKRTLFYKDNSIEYAILNFGGLILKKNKIDKTWKEIIQNKIKQIDFNFIKEELLKLFDFDIQIKVIDNYYISIYNKYYRNNIHINYQIENILKNFIKNKDFNLYINYNNFAIYPSSIGKEKAVKYLIDIINPTFIIGAGDSNADIAFLELCDFICLPKNSLLFQNIKN